CRMTTATAAQAFNEDSLRPVSTPLAQAHGREIVPDGRGAASGRKPPPPCPPGRGAAQSRDQRDGGVRAGRSTVTAGSPRKLAHQAHARSRLLVAPPVSVRRQTLWRPTAASARPI